MGVFSTENTPTSHAISHTDVHMHWHAMFCKALLPRITCVAAINDSSLQLLHNVAYVTLLVGVSLSEPHTSGTALRKCVCNVLLCLRLYTVNLKCSFKYFECPRPSSCTAGTVVLLGYSQSAATATIAETAQT